MARGISPIVAVVLLIAIAVVAAIGLYFWAGGLVTKQSTPQTPISLPANPIGNGKILVANLGSMTLSGLAFLNTTVDGVDCVFESPINLLPGEQASCTLNGAVDAGELLLFGQGTGLATTYLQNDYTCTEDCANGQPCTDNSQCASGLCAGGFCAQPGGGWIYGRVTTSGGVGIASADVWSGATSNVTNASGWYNLTKLGSGAYVVSANKSTYVPRTLSTTVVDGSGTRLDFTLYTAPACAPNGIISSCPCSISTPGVYSLYSDLSATASCIIFNSGAASSSLNGNQYKIIGSNALESSGVQFNATSDVSITEVNISAFRYGVHFNKSVNCSVSDSQFISNSYGAYSASANFSTLQDSVFHKGIWAVYGYSYSNLSILRNDITNSSQVGILLNGEGALVDGNTLRYHKYETVGLTNIANNSIIRNNIMTNSAYGTKSESGTALNVLIQNNTIATMTNDAILLSGSSVIRYTNSAIIDNTIGGYIDPGYTGTSGIKLAYQGNLLISNNNISTYPYGVQVENSQNVTVTENHISNTRQSCIFAQTNTANSFFDNNTLINASYAGIDFSTATTNNRIKGNFLDNMTNQGIHIAGTGHNVTDNVLNKNGFYGINAVSTNSEFYNNIIANASIYGLYIYSGNGCKVINNNVTNCPYGLYLSSTSNTIVSNNRFCAASTKGVYCTGGSNNVGSSIYDTNTGCTGISKTGAC